MIRRVWLVGLALLVLLVAPSVASAKQVLGLSSGSFQFDTSAGRTIDGSVIVINDGTEPLKVLVYGADQSVDKRGGITYTAPSRADLSTLSKPSSWMRVIMPSESKSLGNIPYLELRPKQRVPVKFSIEVPADVAPGDHNVMLFFEMFGNPAGGKNNAASEVSGRIGSRIRLRVNGQFVKRLEVAPFKVPAFVIGGKVPYDFTVNNNGNIDQRIVARISLLNRNDEKIVEAMPINARLVFAGESLSASGALFGSKQPFGPHTVRLDVTPVDDNGNVVDQGKDAITEKRSLWVIPLWLVVLVGIVVVLIVGRLVWLLAMKVARGRVQRQQQPVVSPAAVAVPAAPGQSSPSTAPPAGTPAAVPDPDARHVGQPTIVDNWLDPKDGTGS